MTASVKQPARSLIVAPRLPDFPKEHTGNPFTSVGDVTVDCDVPGCGWHAMGDRLLMKQRIAAHNREYHSQSSEPLVVLLNQPRL